MDMNIKTILLLFLLLIPFAGCDDDDFPFSGKWTNERNDTLEFDEGSLLYKSDSHFIMGPYYLQNDSIFIWPMHSSQLYDYTGYPIEIGDGTITLYNFADMEKITFVRALR